MSARDTEFEALPH